MVGTKEPPDDTTGPDQGAPVVDDVVDDVDDDVDDDAPTPAPRRVETVLQEPLAAGPTELDSLQPDALEPYSPELQPTPAKRMRHDPREVRRLVAMAFSAGELSKFAERWRVFTDREGSVDDGARQLVRALEARDKLGQLVESLRAHKPLFEWPEPSIEVDDPVPAAAAVEPPVAEVATPRESGRGAQEAASSVGAPIVDPFVTRDAAASPDGDVVVPKRWLVAGGGAIVVVLLVLVAVAATRGGEASQPASLAVDAADELARSIAAVRSACKIDEDADSARDALTAAFRRCSVPSIRPSRIDIPVPSRPKPTPTPQPLALPRPAGPVSRRPACLDQCHQIHNQCKTSQCGQEPASAAAYDTYQRCLSGCLSQYSRCRLTCR